MAKKKAVKKTTRRHHTKRRSSLHGAGDMTGLLLIIGGAVASKFVDKMIPATLDKKLVAGGKIALPFILPMLAKDGKTKQMLKEVSTGFAVMGTVDFLTDLNILSGLHGADEFIEVDLAGAQSVLAAIDKDISVINGTQNILGGKNDGDISVINGYKD